LIETVILGAISNNYLLHVPDFIGRFDFLRFFVLGLTRARFSLCIITHAKINLCFEILTLHI
jgi:hypothetical protein